jgi:uroporphyrinogen decarboxylase
MGYDITLNELKEKTDNKVTLLGNIPPRDVLAYGSPEDVSGAVDELINSLEDRSRVVMSCGGGMPPGVSSENLQAFGDAVKKHRK